MATEKKLKSLAAMLDAPEPSPALTKAQTPVGRTMGEALDKRSEMLRENETLKSELLALSKLEHVEKLDPTLIDPSAWANRDEINFSSTDPDFAALKNEIASSGGNVQPIKVRRKQGQRYEVVFGHRRLRACRELGLPVVAIVQDLDDQQLFAEMDRENRARKNLSAWEQGVMYRKAIQEGLFASQRRMADFLGVDQGNIAKAIAIANLPEEVLRAFSSKLDLQFRFASPLAQACQQALEAVLAEAAVLASLSEKPKAAVIVQRLADAATAVQPEAVKPALVSRPYAVKTNKSGALTVTLAESISEDKRRKILEFIEKELS